MSLQDALFLYLCKYEVERYNMKPKDITLGVLGGMGPAATAEFMQILAEIAPASCDQEHPRMIIYSHTITPDRTTYILGKGPDPYNYLKEGLETLTGWGAGLLAVTCNTAHYFIDQFREELGVPLVHIVEETIRKASEISPQGAWLTSTLGTMRTGLYQQYAEKMGYKLYLPDERQAEEIHHATDLVKWGRREEAGELFGKLVNELWSERRLPIIGACTEIPLAYRVAGLPDDMIVSSLYALAEGCVRELY